jgi:peptide chain release factor subunit 1
MLKELASLEGRGTELISLYITPGKRISDVMAYLRDEWGTAVNIKSKTTRKNVQDAIVRIMERLKLFKEIPETGLCIFCGTIPTNKPGVGDMALYTVIPPEPINVYFYRCEHSFILDPLFEMLRKEETYAIIVIDTKDATFALLKGKRLEILKEITSGVAGKHRAGGQSARRFERLREAQLVEFYTRIGRTANTLFLNVPNLKGILLAGPAGTKDEFRKGKHLHYELDAKILSTIDTAYTGLEGVKEVVERSGDILKNVRFYEERKMVQDFLYNVGHDTGLATYGEREVMEALREKNVRRLLVSEGLSRVEVKTRCSSCGYEEMRIMDENEVTMFEQSLSEHKCPKCGNSNTLALADKRDLIEILADMAEAAEAEFEVISKDSEEGTMLKESFGGIAAILKFRQR